MWRALRLAFSAAAIYLLLCAAAGVLLVHGTLHPLHRDLPDRAEVQFRQVSFQSKFRFQDVRMTSYDGAVLRAWFVEPVSGNGDAVLLLHGLGDNRLGMTGYAQLLLDHGYSVLMPDSRAHGLSGGEIATYGLLEENDIRRWFDWMRDNQHSYCIYGLGESMGAAQLLQSLEVEPHFCAIVAESPFSNFREIAYDRIGQQFDAGPWVGRTVLRPVVETALTYSAWKYHVRLAGVSPENSVEQTHVPVLLIHGVRDSNIPVRHSLRIKARNAAVALWEVPGADHCGAISAAPTEFARKVLGWFRSHRDNAQ